MPERPYHRLRGLPCWPEVQQRLLDGQPVAEVARVIQVDQHMMQDVQPASLERMLRAYKRRVLGLNASAATTPEERERLQVLARATRRRHGSIEVLRWALSVQTYRVQFLTERETLTQIPNEHLYKEVETLRRLVETVRERDKHDGAQAARGGEVPEERMEGRAFLQLREREAQVLSVAGALIEQRLLAARAVREGVTDGSATDCAGGPGGLRADGAGGDGGPDRAAAAEPGVGGGVLDGPGDVGAVVPPGDGAADPALGGE